MFHKAPNFIQQLLFLCMATTTPKCANMSIPSWNVELHNTTEALYVLHFTSVQETSTALINILFLQPFCIHHSWAISLPFQMAFREYWELTICTSWIVNFSLVVANLQSQTEYTDSSLYHFISCTRKRTCTRIHSKTCVIEKWKDKRTN